MKKTMGRPRTFDRESALAKATDVFCRYGYEGTSVSKLNEAMGINSPSLYAAFGDKEQLFMKVLDSYHSPHFDIMQDILLSEKDCFTAFEKLLLFTKDAHIANTTSGGCLIVNSTINNNDEHETIAKKLQSLHNKNEKLLFTRLQKGKEEGDIPKDVDIKALARYINGILQGAAVLIRGQKSGEAVNDLITQAINSLKFLMKKT